MPTELEQNSGVEKRRRWDVASNEASKKPKTSEWDEDTEKSSSRRNRWDETPERGGDSSSSRRNRWDETPERSSSSRSGWDETPKKPSEAETPSRKSRSRWDETPQLPPGAATPMMTPTGNMGEATPSQMRGMTPEHIHAMRWEREIDERNRHLSDEELDAMLPRDGYKILDPPAGYVPIRTPARKIASTPVTTPGFMMQEESAAAAQYGVSATPLGLPEIKPEDRPYFEKLLEEEDEDKLTPEEARDRKIMKLLLKVKNGTPPQRKQALRQLTDKARDFGPGPLFSQILPLLMSPTLEDQERHLLVKVIDRVLYKLDDLVRPFVHKILVVIEPLLIDEDYYARVEGREIISNLAKAAGLATMIATMRPDIDNPDEYVRNTTARAFSVVASALGIPSLLPFLKAVCQSKKSWQARHTGIKIVQQIAILMGCAVLPHLKGLVEIIGGGLEDEQQK